MKKTDNIIQEYRNKRRQTIRHYNRVRKEYNNSMAPSVVRVYTNNGWFSEGTSMVPRGLHTGDIVDVYAGTKRVKSGNKKTTIKAKFNRYSYEY